MQLTIEQQETGLRRFATLFSNEKTLECEVLRAEMMPYIVAATEGPFFEIRNAPSPEMALTFAAVALSNQDIERSKAAKRDHAAKLEKDFRASAKASSDGFPPMVTRAMRRLEKLLGCKIEHTLPPGLAGQMVSEVMEMLTAPRQKFAVGAVLAKIDSLAGRAVSMGLMTNRGGNLMFTVAGQAYTAKTSSVSVTTGATKGALHGRYSYRNSDGTYAIRHEPEIGCGLPDNVAQLQLNSKEGLHGVVVDKGGAALVEIQDAESLVRQMTGAKPTPMGIALKGELKNIWDICCPDGVYSPGASRQTRLLKVKPAIAPHVTVYMTVTPDALTDLDIKDVQDGYFSRPLFIYDASPVTVDIRREKQCRKLFSREIVVVLNNLALDGDIVSVNMQQAIVSTKDEATGATGYAINQQAHTALAYAIHYADLTPDAEELFTQIKDETIRIVGAAQSEHDRIGLPEFGVLVRVAENAKRIATRLTQFEIARHQRLYPDGIKDAYGVPISVETMRWALVNALAGYFDLLAAYERGEIGVSMNKARSVLVEGIKRKIHGNRRHADHEFVLNVGKLKSDFGNCNPFKKAVEYGKQGRVMVAETLVEMVRDGLLIAVPDGYDYHYGVKGEAVKPDLNHPDWQ